MRFRAPVVCDVRVLRGSWGCRVCRCWAGVWGHRPGAEGGGGAGGMDGDKDQGGPGGGRGATTGLRERGNATTRHTGHSGRQNAATRRNMRREERVTVQGLVKEQQPDGMSHGGGRNSNGATESVGRTSLLFFFCCRWRALFLGVSGTWKKQPENPMGTRQQKSAIYAFCYAMHAKKNFGHSFSNASPSPPL